MPRAKHVVLSNLLTWSLTDGDMAFVLPPGTLASPDDIWQLLYTGTSTQDILTFGGNFSLECARLSRAWLDSLAPRHRLRSLLLLLGAGGAILYCLRRSRRSRPPASAASVLSSLVRGLWDWLYSEELIEDPSSFYDSYSLNSYYFGPDLSQYRDPGDLHDQVSSNDAEDEDSDDDLSLNCLSNKTSPVKFLKKPLFDLSRDGTTSRFKGLNSPFLSIEDQVTDISPVSSLHPPASSSKGRRSRLRRHHLLPPSSSSSSTHSGSPIFRFNMKTSTPETQTEEDQVLQRTVAFSRLTHAGLGLDALRMRGDGGEGLSHLSRDTSLSSLAEISVSGGMSVSNSMMELVRDARQVRRLIREVSLDSQDSDIDLELRETTGEELERFQQDMSKLIENCDERNSLISENGNNPGEECNNTDDVSGSERSLPRDSSIPDFNLIEKKTCINRRLWKLTGFSEYESLNFSENSDHDNASLVSYKWFIMS